MKVKEKASKISQNTSVQATTTRHFPTPDQNRENYDSKVVQVVLTRLVQVQQQINLRLASRRRLRLRRKRRAALLLEGRCAGE